MLHPRPPSIINSSCSLPSQNLGRCLPGLTAALLPLRHVPHLQAYTPQPCTSEDMSAFHSEEYLEALQSVNIKVRGGGTCDISLCFLGITNSPWCVWVGAGCKVVCSGVWVSPLCCRASTSRWAGAVSLRFVANWAGHSCGKDMLRFSFVCVRVVVGHAGCNTVCGVGCECACGAQGQYELLPAT
jgi:hypothetical protein